MASLWQFGNDGNGLLIVSADSMEEAIEKRDQWKLDQLHKDEIRADYWKVATDAGLMDLNQRNYNVIRERFGPFPEGGLTYYKVDLDPINIGDYFEYMWIE